MKRRASNEEDRPELRRIIGIDGEGHDTPDGRHIYIYLAAVDDTGRLVAEAYDPEGLSHQACLDMLLSLPADALKFGFMFSYDVTKIIEEMPIVERFYLMRPKLRDRSICSDCKTRSVEPIAVCPSCGGEEVRRFTEPVRWRGYVYDFFNGSLSIRHLRKKVKVWDCFRFFGCAFVEALKDWKVGTEEQVARISDMKQKRGSFEDEDPEAIKRYCREECHLLAVMMRRVIEAHDKADIPLKRFDGAGSTATALLRAHDVASFKGPRHKDLDPNLAHAIACAFVGGRFEDSMVGIVRAPVDGDDISSAYPFALTFMPCLRCGSWRKTTDLTFEDLNSNPIIVARYRVRSRGPKERKEMAWCPLPFRDEKGSIAYGIDFFGWAWAPELVAALDGWPDLVELTGEAWIYETPCDHKPFGFMPQVYRRRVEWGKEGAGKALKLGANASYGKTAQSIGDDPPFQSWIWAGLTTATARGQILIAIALAKDPWNVLTIATDGIYSLEPLPILKPPRSTGTSDLQKPLGGWERKTIPEGVFVAKPGLYYRLQPKLSEVRARGIGRRETFAFRDRLEKGFLDWNREDVRHHVTVQSRRFHGAKNSLYANSSCTRCRKTWPGVPEQGCPLCREPGDKFKIQEITDEDGKPVYGLWNLRTVQVAFDPHPKRERVGLSKEGTWCRLHVRDLEGRSSAPYDVGTAATTPEGQSARNAKEIQLEQPDWDESDQAV